MKFGDELAAADLMLMRVALTLGTCALLAGPLGCGVSSDREAPKPAADLEHAKPETPAPQPQPQSPPPSGLPEDPVAGKRSEQQWHEQMVHEEEERQLAFDRNRLKQHRAVLRLIVTARARYDHARNEAAVSKVRADMPQRIAEIRQRVTELDHWGVNSRLLPDYDALATSLSGAYADAKLAAIQGDAHALDALQVDFDQRLKKMNAWLKEAAESEDE